MFDSVDSFLKSGYDSPIILIFGEDEFSREEAQNKIIDKYIVSDDDKFNFDIYDGDSIQASSLIDICYSYPMMSDKRVVVVKRFEKLFSGRTSKKIETSSPFNSYMKNPASTTKLILIADIESAKDMFKTYKTGDKGKFEKKVSSLKFPFNQIITKFGWLEFPRVYESEFPNWTRLRFKQFGKTIQSEAVDMLLSKTKQSLRDINNEIDKIILAIGKRTNITIDDINFLTGANREFTVFELQKNIADKNLSKSVMILNKMLANDRQEMLILAIISKFFINMLKIVEDSKSNVSPQNLAGKLGISTFQFNDYQTALRNYSIFDIENAIIKLTETDLKLKSTNSDSLLIMQDLLFGLMDKKVEIEKII